MARVLAVLGVGIGMFGMALSASRAPPAEPASPPGNSRSMPAFETLAGQMPMEME